MLPPRNAAGPVPAFISGPVCAGRITGFSALNARKTGADHQRFLNAKCRY
jgi:hypothetical protein